MTLDAIARELRHAARTLRRSASFTTIATLTLAIGIGATTAIFALLDAVVLRPLPYPAADRLVVIDHVVPGVGPEARWRVAEAEYFYLRRHARTLDALGVFRTGTATLLADGNPERVEMGVVSASLVGVLGARPVVGRAIRDGDDRPGAAPVVMLSHGFWMRRYGGDLSIVGKTITLDETQRQVVGVLEPGVELPDLPTAIWIPLELDSARRPVNSHYLSAIARLPAGVATETAERELTSLVQRFPAEMPSAYSTDFLTRTGFAPRVVPLRDSVIGGMGRVLWILLASVGLVLLIACANVANLFLVRAEGRRREVAIRSALGAGRTQLAWHYVTESVLLALVAGLLALLFADLALQTLVTVAPPGIPRIAGVDLGWRSVVFAAGVSVAAGVIFGLFPLARATLDLGALRDGGRGLTVSKHRQAVRQVLLTGQVALALVLLTAAGLMLQSVRNLHDVQPGLRPTGTLTMDVSLPWARYPGYPEVSAFYRQLIGRLEALPEVQSAGAITSLPFRTGRFCAIIFVEDRPTDDRAAGCVGVALVAPGYFDAMGIAVRGRPFTWEESDRADGGVVVTRALADRLWPGEDPLGRGIKGNGPQPPFYRVVGVAMDVREEGLDKPPTEAVYFPMRPVVGASLWSPPRAMTVVVRSQTGRAEALTTAVRQTLAELDPQIPLANVQTMEQVVARSMVRTSFTMLLLSIAASMALLLSAVGIFGVISYIVGQRRGEIGIRLALGADPSRVSWLVVLQAVRLAAIGIVIGVGAALGVTRVMRALLFEVSPNDPLVLASVAGLLVVLAGVASYAPARRSGRIDPAEVLRGE